MEYIVYVIASALIAKTIFDILIFIFVSIPGGVSLVKEYYQIRIN